MSKPKYAREFKAELAIWTRRAKGEAVNDTEPMCKRFIGLCQHCPLGEDTKFFDVSCFSGLHDEWCVADMAKLKKAQKVAKKIVAFIKRAAKKHGVEL